jgi:hypothetical protein
MAGDKSAFTRVFNALCPAMTQKINHRPISGRLIIATHNAGKLREMRELLAPYCV